MKDETRRDGTRGGTAPSRTGRPAAYTAAQTTGKHCAVAVFMAPPVHTAVFMRGCVCSDRLDNPSKMKVPFTAFHRGTAVVSLPFTAFHRLSPRHCRR